MTTKTALLALLTMWGVGAYCSLPARAEEMTAPAEAEASDDIDGVVRLTDKVWVRADAGEDLPGPMHIFLSDGTMVSDSCWETYRLSEWKTVDDRNLSWNEDGIDITAEILSMSHNELVLSLKLGGGAEEQRFVQSDVPYVCPDMPK
jgi:hypothetical protein